MHYKQIFLTFLAFAQTATIVKSAQAVVAQNQTEPNEYLSGMSLGCTGDLQNYYFNLKGLTRELDLDDRNASEVYALEYETTEGTNSIEFNICERTARQCPDLKDDFANIINANQTCNHLSRVLEKDIPKPGAMQLISEESPELGVMMMYEGGNMCNETHHFQLIVQINCNPNIETTTFALDKESLNTPCDPKVIMNSPHGCPVLSTGPLGQFIVKFAWYLGVPLLGIGMYLLTVGGRYPKTTLALFTTLAASLTSLFVLFAGVFPANSPAWSVLVVGFVTFSMGGGLGYGAAKWPRIGIVSMGLSLGSLIGYTVYWLFLESHLANSDSLLLQWAVVAITGLTCGIICVFLFDYAVIITSAIFGAYSLIRGVSMYAGGFVNEFEIVMATNNGELGELSGMMWVYVALIVLIAWAGMRGQIKDRAHHLEMYSYKGHFNTQYTDYKTMRAKYSGRSAGGHNYGSFKEDSQPEYSDDNEESHLKQ